MARIASACPREAHAIWHWLAAGWSGLGNILLGRFRPAPAALVADTADPADLSQGGSPQTHCPYPIPMRAAASPAAPAWIDLMAQFSHDLRTPLNAVIGFSDVMSAELLGPVGHPRYREYAGDIGESGRRLLKAAEDTLALTSLLAQSAHRTPQPVALAALAHATWGACAGEAEIRGVGLIVETGHDGDIEALAPAQALRQVVVNLLTEALSRAPDGGRVVLRAVGEDDTVRLEIVVPCARSRTTGAAPSLAMGLARTMLELQGAGLIEITGGDGTWRAVTVLDRAVQQDFFASVVPGTAWGRVPATV